MTRSTDWIRTQKCACSEAVSGDDARGGDIDLLVISETLDRKLLRSLRLWLQDRLGLRKMDVVVSAPELPSPFARLAFEEGVPL